MKPDILGDWLAYIERQHVNAIALGLDRVEQVKSALRQTQTCPVIVVGGTNGKGSTCAFLEAILLRAGYRVGMYTSPHILHYNERVRVCGTTVDDSELCAAFAKVEAVRQDVPLTYFEFGTLAAWEIFSGAALDAIILEVGLGGRLDAVNAYDADCAIVVSIGLDHTDYLGGTRELIGREKAGIFRSGRVAICGDADPPASLVEQAQLSGADLKVIGRDFGYRVDQTQWQYWGWNGNRSGLAHPALRGHHQLINASCAIAALGSLQDVLPVAMQDIRRGLMEIELSGRFQILPGRPTVVLDVAHNPHAARLLAKNLGSMAFHPETWAVFGVMADKDIKGIVEAIGDRVTRWLPCALDTPRAAAPEMIQRVLVEQGLQPAVYGFASPALAYAHAGEQAGEDDRILVFGSFLTVADVLRNIER